MIKKYTVRSWAIC